MWLRIALGCSLLLAASGATPVHAGPVHAPSPCAQAASGPCVGAEPGLIRPADWWDDLFGLSLPSGSWRDSCRKARVEGHFLTAECRRKNGSYRDASFDLRRCGGGDLENDNGKFVCGRQARGEGGENKTGEPLGGKD